ncbi:hypothetical protein [uncultured Roseobacter sp.]|uniref:hypothetical protein n=1 Tax=uncultured Roseobacter sp. TaxID=114847 RepID=UPI0026143373|nr:hypothetical protein [uncultured Roseobacter sp.]
MSERILHLGAHRTGTTSLQRFLRQNADVLKDADIRVLSPPDSRQGTFTDLVSRWVTCEPSGPRTRLVVSEENVLGTMGHNISTGILYPNAKENLRSLAAVYRPDVILLSVRELADYWTSAILYSLCRKEIRFPSASQLGRICEGARSWKNVVEDVQSVFPQARLVVREFAHLQDNPKRFLRVATQWQDLAEAKLNRQPRNAGPGEDAVISHLLDSGDFDGLARLGRTRESRVFSDAQRQQMDAAYQSDLEALWRLLGPSLLESREHPRGAAAKPASKPAKRTPDRPARTVFLTIGRTGGSQLKSLAQADGDRPEALYFGGHEDTLVSTIKRFGRARKLAFFFRDPQTRFTSGFNARLRQGRPCQEVSWSTAEAVAFSFFRTPNALAEALFAQDDYLKSAARFSAASIFHLKYGHAHYLHSPEAVSYELERGTLLVCCETAHIDRQMTKILSRLDLAPPGPDTVPKTAVPTLETPLSKLAISNLTAFYPKEFEVYAACRSAAEALGFS